jgi:N-dimethylarginine dimethylaminohydrolase
MAIHNEYSQLKEVILGISSKIYPAFDLPQKMIDGLDFTTLLQYKLPSIIFKNRSLPKRPTFMMIKELEALNTVLREQNVKVHRLEPIVPLEHEDPGLMQMYARDPVFIIGKKAIVGNMALKMRKKEYRGYEPLFKYLETNGYEIIHMPKDDRTILEGGDVIIDSPYVYVGFGTYISTLEGIKWLQRILKKEYEVIPIEIKDQSIMHLDCCMTIIGKNKGIVHRASLGMLPGHFGHYDFIEVEAKTRKQLGTNVFMINPETIVVQKRHEILIGELRSRGYKVYPLKFNLLASIGGAFRCATCPVDRE